MELVCPFDYCNSLSMCVCVCVCVCNSGGFVVTSHYLQVDSTIPMKHL